MRRGNLRLLIAALAFGGIAGWPAALRRLFPSPLPRRHHHQDQANEQNAVLFIGILFGVWGALVVAVAQLALRSWVRGRMEL